jgi:hypothetical protein
MGLAARERALGQGALDDHLTRLLDLFRSLRPR